MELTVHDLARLQSDYPDYRMELVDGEIIVSSPSGYQAAEIAAELAIQLLNWIRPRQLGRVTGSRAGFKLPNLDIRTTSVAFVRAERLRRSPRSFAELAPDLVVEVKSPTDSLAKPRDKIQAFLALGTQVGLLINPESRQVEVYRLNEAATLLGDGDTLTIPDLLPGWAIAVADLWPLVFE